MVNRRFALVSMGFAIALCAASAPGSTQEKVVKVNLAAESFLDTIPYWESFVVQGGIPDTVQRVVVAYKPVDGGTVEMAEWVRAVAGYEAKGQFSVNVEPLQPNRTYLFCFAVYGALDPIPGLSGGGIPVVRAGGGCEPLLANARRRYGEPAHVRVIPDARPSSSWQEHFDADLGIMGTQEARYLGVVTGVHISLAPVRKDVNLLDPNLSMAQTLGRRVSLYAGISPVEIRSDTDQPVKKTGLGIPVVGIGFRGPFYWFASDGLYSRITQMMHLNVGVMFFEQEDANPVVDTNRAKRDVFISLTGDLEVKDVLAPLAGVLGVGS